MGEYKPGSGFYMNRANSDFMGSLDMTMEEESTGRDAAVRYGKKRRRRNSIKKLGGP